MEIVAKRSATLQGERKVGFDANVMVAIIDNPTFNSKKIDSMFDMKDTFFLQEIAYNETIKILKRPPFEYSHSKEKVDKFLKKKNIRILGKIPSHIPTHPTLGLLIKQCKEKSVDFHYPDIHIVADYLAHGVNKAYSADKTFLQIAEVAGIDAEDFLKLDDKQKEGIKRFLQQPFHKSP